MLPKETGEFPQVVEQGSILGEMGTGSGFKLKAVVDPVLACTFLPFAAVGRSVKDSTGPHHSKVAIQREKLLPLSVKDGHHSSFQPLPQRDRGRGTKRKETEFPSDSQYLNFAAATQTTETVFLMTSTQQEDQDCHRTQTSRNSSETVNRLC